MIDLSFCNQLVAENLNTFLDYFQLEYKKSGNCYNLVCPFHYDADNESGFAIYHNKTYIVAYCRTNCDKSVKRDGKMSENNHMVKPDNSPTNAPALVAPFQKIPPKIIGPNCPMATKAIKPIETSEK